MNILTIIPARGGSKGVPGKNHKLLNSKPLIEYTLDVALLCPSLQDIYVTTDDVAIWEILKEYPSIKLHKREAALATDTSSINDTIKVVLEIAEKEQQKHYDCILLLQVTAPLREPFHVEEAISLLDNNVQCNSLISFVEMSDIHPARLYHIEDNKAISYMPEMESANRQELPKAYLRNGSIYIVRRDAFLYSNKIMTPPTFPYVMDEKYWINIDTMRDFYMAEALIRKTVIE